VEARVEVQPMMVASIGLVNENLNGTVAAIERKNVFFVCWLIFFRFVLITLICVVCQLK